MTIFRVIILCIMLGISMVVPDVLYAQKIEKVFRDWSVFTVKTNGKKICYIASEPKSKKGNYTRRDDPYLLVTYVDNTTQEVSTSSGYPYKLNSEVTTDIEGAKYKLFTKGELAWAYDELQDRTMIKHMVKGINLKVRGVSRKGTYSIDSYSLRGFKNAYDYMRKLCS